MHDKNSIPPISFSRANSDNFLSLHALPATIISLGNNDKFANFIREFNAHVKNDNRVEQMILPIGDGLTICRKL